MKSRFFCSSRICVANYPGLWYRFRGRLGNGDRSEPTAGVGSGPTQVKLSSHSPRGHDRQGFQTDLPPPSTHRYARRLICCGYENNADIVGAINVRRKGRTGPSAHDQKRIAREVSSQALVPFARSCGANSENPPERCLGNSAGIP